MRDDVAVKDINDAVCAIDYLVGYIDAAPEDHPLPLRLLCARQALVRAKSYCQDLGQVVASTQDTIDELNASIAGQLNQHNG